MKKALVFYRGKPPKGIKTNWIMHEYRLIDNNTSNKPPGCHDLGNKKNSLRLDDWVLCRIYKKNNTHRPMDQEDSMDDGLGSSFPLSKLHHLPPKSTTASYAQFLDNDHNFFDGMVSNDGINSSGSFVPNVALANSSHSLKRGLPNLYWTDQEDEAGPSRRLQLDNSDSTGNGSIATLLSQLPQTPPSLHQQPMLGGSQLSGDGLFRGTPYQLPGMNWYS